MSFLTIFMTLSYAIWVFFDIGQWYFSTLQQKILRFGFPAQIAISFAGIHNLFLSHTYLSISLFCSSFIIYLSKKIRQSDSAMKKLLSWQNIVCIGLSASLGKTAREIQAEGVAFNQRKNIGRLPLHNSTSSSFQQIYSLL